ncbi:MAG: hypothetical protein HDT42_12185 [Ruminococcaceae bacterium]|nr:hypothetical protein [Oscillospiraceae bacterium]
MDVINVNGTTTRGYSLKLSSLFSFGEFRPCNDIDCEKPTYRYEALIFDEIEVNDIIVKLPIKLKTEKSQ